MKHINDKFKDRMIHFTDQTSQHTFHLTSEQLATLKEWKVKQREQYTRDFPGGAAGGIYTYSFTPTGLGMVISVTNGITKETINLTDYNEW